MLSPDTVAMLTLLASAVILITVFGIMSRIIAMRNRVGIDLERLEAKLDLLLRQANIKYDPKENIPREIAAALRAGRAIEAIKLYRDATGVGLRQAKDVIDGYQTRLK